MICCVQKACRRLPVLAHKSARCMLLSRADRLQCGSYSKALVRRNTGRCGQQEGVESKKSSKCRRRGILD